MDKTNLKDHRQIGHELDLFSFHDNAPGAVFWHPKGWIIYNILQGFIRKKLSVEGYQEISTPTMVKRKLFEQSGHWEHFRENIFTFELAPHGQTIVRSDGRKTTTEVIPPLVPEDYSLKPMNCPEATMVYSTKTRSYQDLPLRLSEFGILHRNELSGVLGGLFRVRQFVIDDAHHFVRSDQIQEEIHKLILLVVDFYKSLNFNPEFYFATKPDKAMGDPKVWEKAEEDLETALKEAKVKYGIKQKDGAFYGPKIDIHIRDSQDRDWQLATIQLDFQIPERMKLEYIDNDGKPKRPIIIHRAILGSLERFIGILTEHYQGAFPLWLAPVQVLVLPIADRHEEYAKKIVGDLREKGIRTELDNRQERLQAKIRDSSLQKVPYLGIIGDRETESGRSKVEDRKISVRTRTGKNIGQTKLSEFIKRLKEEIDKKI